jgi:two-component system LytT family sensor kinase
VEQSSSAHPLPSTRSPSLIAFLAVAGVCLILGGITALEARHVSVTHGVHVHWPGIVISTMPRWVALAATLPFVLVVATRVPLTPLRWQVIAMHIALFAAISVLHAAVDAWAMGQVAPAITQLFGLIPRLARSWYNTMPTVVGMYAAVLFAAWGMTEARERERRTLRASELEAQLQTARLAALRAQLQPHFLYNTLNGIAALVTDRETAKAVTAIEQLAALLHAALRDDGREVVTLRDEVALAERYLMLQQMRFGDRLRHSVSLAPEVADTPVPVLLLQPIVENAVVHGLEAGQATLHVVIAARPLDGAVELRVENDGTALDAPGRADGHGIGLAATRARLSTAFGEHASLEMLPRGAGGVVVQVILPAPVPGAPVPGAPPP